MQTRLTTPVEIEITIGGAAVEGKATLETRRRTYAVEAHAARHEDGSIDDWAIDLAVARLLRNLEVALMERVHERIDRSIADE